MAIMAAIWMKKNEKRSATVVLVSGNSMWIDDCTMRAARTATARVQKWAGAAVGGAAVRRVAGKAGDRGPADENQ